MTTYEDARRAVTDLLIGSWTEGEFATAAEGFEDAEAFVVPFGNARYIRGGDRDFMTPTDELAVVDKATGVARLETQFSFGARAREMSSVSA